MEYKIGLRPSRLAIKQGQELERLLPCARFKLIPIETQGDKDKITPIFAVEGSDFFTREIEEALLRGDVDLAVHSAKDLEEELPEGLTIAAITASISPYECLVCRRRQRLGELPQGAVIGTSSAKRQAAIRRYRPDLAIRDIRGSIEERLEQLDKGKYDAIIMAHAALLRLGYEDRIAEIIPPEIIAPHPLQGSLAVEVRSRDEQLIRLFSVLDTRKGAVLDEPRTF